MAEILDPHVPALHRVHPRGWLNDPNGILRTDDGRWHVFFQYNPAAPRHENIHWGHMSSPDLVSWRQEPLGPTPRPGEADQDGCWSGVGLIDRSADPAGAPTLVYSGVDGVDNQLARVLVARLEETAAELVEPGVVAADIPPIPGLIGVRDPFVLTLGGRRWGIQGAGIREGDGYVPAILLYSCDDLERWEYVGQLLRGDDPVAAEHAPADLWECPQLVEVDGRWVLLLSLWRHPDRGGRSTIQVNYLVGDLTQDSDGIPRFAPSTGGQVDLGPDFYAPQAVVDSERVLLWGWSWEGLERTQEQTDAQGWAGTLTFPRELRLDGDLLLARAPDELRALRGGRLEITDGEPLDLPVPARAEVRVRGAVRVEIVGLDHRAGEVLAADDGPATVFLDGSLLELIPDDATPHTMRLYPEVGDTVRVRGDVEEAWLLERPDGGT